MTTRESETPAVRNILVAVDLGPESADAVAYAFELARAVGAKVHVVHVFRPLAVPSSRRIGRGAFVDLQRDQSFDDLHHDVLLALHRLTSRYDAEPLRGKLIAAAGDRATRIVETAEQVDADIVVLGRRAGLRARTNMRGNLIRSVVRAAPCPVLVR